MSKLDKDPLEAIPEDLPPAKMLTLEEFIAESKPNIGLVASFKVEAKNTEPRSCTAWEEAFDEQSNRVYK